MSKQLKHREEWLHSSVSLMQPLFAKLNKKIPDNLRISCGWPSSGAFGAKRRTLGQCWNPLASSDKHHEIFVSPIAYEPLDVLGIVVHEVIHAVVGTEQKHAGMFKVVATAMGLEGRMTSTTVGARLLPSLKEIHKSLGNYPHSKLDKTMLEKPKKPSSTTKIKCDCGYGFTISNKILEEFGLPATCVCGQPLGEFGERK